MKAFVSLHTGKPTRQSEHEVSYAGYARVEIDFTPDIGQTPLKLKWPTVQEKQSGEICYICIGSNETGDGEMGPVIHTMPYQTMEKDYIPAAAIINWAAGTDGYFLCDGLPATVPHIAQVIYYRILAGEIKPEDLHPAVYEALNDELVKVGVAVIPVTRAGTGTLVQTFGSLSELGEALGQSVH